MVHILINGRNFGCNSNIESSIKETPFQSSNQGWFLSVETLDMRVNYAEEKQKARMNKLGMLIFLHGAVSLNVGESENNLLVFW